MSADPIQSLKVLLVLPLYGGSLPIGRYCGTALRDIGHTVEIFESPDFHGAFRALQDLSVRHDRFEQLESAFMQFISQAILAKVESFEPDLVLCMAQAPMTRQTLKRLKRDGVPTAMWFIEDFRVFTYWRAFAPYYDFFAVIQKEPFLTELAQLGVQALYLPLAGLPDFHCPRVLSAAEQRMYDADISFLGAGYPNRRLIFRNLVHLDFKIWGNDWDGEQLLASHVQKQGERISPEESVLIYQASRINLNLHSSVQAKTVIEEGDFVNPRTFELACMGAFQLVDRRSLMSELFAEDELATFSSVHELQDKIVYFLAHPEERQLYAQRARARTLRQHTYQQRMKTLLAEICTRISFCPRARTELPLFEKLPENLRAELFLLLQRLNLSANVSFEELVSRVRQEKGALGAVETSLLFLDEWRKQYSK